MYIKNVYFPLQLRDTILPCVEENEQLKSLLSDESLWSFVDDVIIMHGITRYLASPACNSATCTSTQLSKMDQTLFRLMATF